MLRKLRNSKVLVNIILFQKLHNLRERFVDITVDIAIEYYFAKQNCCYCCQLTAGGWKLATYESHLFYSTLHVNSDNKS